MNDPSDRPLPAAAGRVKRWVMPILSIALFVLACTAIYRILGELDYAELSAKLASLSATQVALALLCTLASFMVLTGYDWSALRYLRKAVPFRTVALAAFCGCAIANTVGANILSGGSVRYRLYVPAGLRPLEVTQITLFGMVAYAVGNLVIASAALVLDPALIARFVPLSEGVLRGIGIAGLVIFLAELAVVFLRRAPLRLGRRALQLPSWRIAVLQLLVTLTDIMLAGACFYIVLNEPAVPFLGFLAVYTIATVAGMLSHVPGGLGVFESILLISFHSLIPTAALAAALLAYRVIYNLVPLLAATLLLTARGLGEHRAGG